MVSLSEVTAVDSLQRGDAVLVQFKFKPGVHFFTIYKIQNNRDTRYKTEVTLKKGGGIWFEVENYLAGDSPVKHIVKVTTI